MSDTRSNVASAAQRRAGDAGMTLPEVLIAITILGIIISVISSALIVTLRQQSSTEGRLNVARSEQSIGLWLPGDLASAGVVSVEPDWSPCGNIEVDGKWEVTGAVCPPLGLPVGSSALMLGWSYKDAADNATYTNVSYQFYQDTDGTFTLSRVECVLADVPLDTSGKPVLGDQAWTCEHIVVLRDLEAPPAGTPWEPGVTKPFWVIEISQPLAALDPSDGSNPGDPTPNPDDEALGATKNAKRVIVTINGGGTFEGAGGGVNRISITAGGTTRRVIDGSSMVGAPSFVEARSLCGGPMSLLIDESNSIGRPDSGGSAANVNNVKKGVRDFINALTGTPVKLQVIGFHTFSHALGTTQWHRYFDMANETDVAALLAAVNTLKFDWSGESPKGGTNWEEGLFRAFYTEAGLTAEPVPNRVVFFTDGIPTFDRLVHRTGSLPADPPDPGPAWAVSTGSSYSQVAFNRADFIAREFRGPIDLIGVGVGSIASGTENWVASPKIGYRTVWSRAYRQYQRYGYQTNRQFQRASAFESNLDFEAAQYTSTRDFEIRPGSSYRDATPTEYYEFTGTKRIRSSARSTYSVTKAEYDAYRGLGGTWNVTWSNTTPTLFYAGDVVGQGDADGWRTTSGTSWRSVTEAEYETFRSAQPARWRVKTWSDTTPTDYFGGQPTRPDKYQIGTSTSWRSVTPQEYALYNTTSDQSDGWRVDTSTSTWVTKAEYDANNTTSDSSDGWGMLPAPEYVSAGSAIDWVDWPGS
ncbi:MAG TPA: VWA domain-containing protein, partial [Ilumatobacteraceae bacterium]|nr:VWA domain-containing protein [Ilumatobacteraceae bacterium]